MTSRPSVIAKNAVGLFLLQFVVKGLSAVWTFYLARRLGAASYGLWASILALTSIFGVLQGFGILSIVVRDVSQDPTKSKNYFGASILIYAAAATISFCLVLLAGFSLGYPLEKIVLVAVAAFSFILYAPGLASQSVLYGHEKFILFTIISSIGTVLYIFLGAAAVESNMGVLGVFAALCTEYAILSFYLFFRTSKMYGRPVFEGAGKLGMSLARLGLPLVLSTVLVELILRVDRIILERFLGSAQVGFYHAAFNLVYLPREIFIIPLITAVYTRMCSTYVDDRKVFERLFEKVNIALLLVGLPIASFCVLMPEATIRIFYGQGYAESVPILRILIWMLPFSFFVIVWQNVFIIQNRTKMIFLINAFGALFNILANILLIPRFGTIASASVAVATQALMVGLIFWNLRHETLFHFSRRIWRILFACGGTLFLISFFKPANPSTMIYLAIFFAGVVVYGLLLVVFKAITKEEIRWLENQFRATSGPLREALGFGKE